VETCSSASSTHSNFYLKKTLKSQFLAEFQKFHLWADFGKFGQFWAVLGRFGQIWADFPAFTVAESMPELGLKSSKPHNF
jgi:hypothetical protein